MAKVLFINPVIRENDVPRHVPYGIALLAALAMEKGHLVQVFDANAWRPDDNLLRDVLQADQWDVIATGGISTTYGYVKKICKFSKEYSSESLIIVGGGLLTSIPKDLMKLLPEIDVGVVGEGFITFNEILAAIDAGQMDFSKITGVIYRGENGVPTLTEQRPLLRELDSLPYPAFDLFPLEDVYFKNSQALYSEEGFLAKRRIDINMSYGCSLVCKFCFHLGIAGDMKYTNDGNVVFDAPGTWTRTIRYHSPRYVIDFVKFLRKKYDIDFVTFMDENLMTMDLYSKRTWLTEICELWIKEGLAPSKPGDPIHWSGTSHARLCTPEILKLMRKAGCSHLVYGYESFSPQILKRLGKGTTPEVSKQSFLWTMQSGIRPVPNQMIGFPTEDFDSIRDSMKAWVDLGIVVKPFYATPYPGSFWYDIYKDRILEQYDNNLDAFLDHLGDATEITAVISENFTAVELYGLREAMVRMDYKRIAEYEAIWKARNPHADAIKKTELREANRKTELQKVGMKDLHKIEKPV